MQVIGLDLSLVCTGMADAGGELTWAVKPGKLRGYERLRFIRAAVLKSCVEANTVVVEGPSFRSSSSSETGHHERAGLWWFVTEALAAADIPLVVVSPAGLKKYATGKGNAPKDEVLLAASKRFSWFTGNNDQADALWLSAIGYDLGQCSVLTMPEKHRQVLMNVEFAA